MKSKPWTPILWLALLALLVGVSCARPLRWLAGVRRQVTGVVQPAQTSVPIDSPQPPGGTIPAEASPQPADGGEAPLADGKGVGSMALTQVEDAIAREAVCNDGTPAKYYFRAGNGQGQFAWVIHLQGGGFCFDNASCEQRRSERASFLTSRGLPANRQGDGLQSISNSRPNEFSAANHVFVHYCSSDLWSGNRAATSDTSGRHFRGARIFEAVIEDLMNPAITPQPNLSRAQQIVLSGSSAGGAGVMVHLDSLSNRLPSASIWGINDAGWFVDMDPLIPSVPSPSQAASQGYAYWNGRVDASCASDHRGSEGLCYLGPVAYPYIRAPIFVQIAQFDGPQLVGLGVRPPVQQEERAYALEFAQAVRNSLRPVGAAFSPATQTHGLLLGRQFWDLRIEGVSLQEAIANWIFDRRGPTKLIGER